MRCYDAAPMKKVLLLLLFALTAEAGTETWTQRGPWGAAVHSFATSRGVVYAGTYTGVYRSDDEGRTWRRIHEDGADVDVDPNNANVVYLSRVSGLLRSIDGGETWTQLWHDIVMPLHVDDQSRLWGVFINGDVAVSSDRGVHWETVTPVRASSILSSESVLFAESQEEGRAYRSTDEGGSWQPLNLPAGTWDIAVSPDEPWNILALAGDRLLRSNNGVTWDEVQPPATSLRNLHVDGSRVVAVADQAVFLSENSGTTWREVLRDERGGLRFAEFVNGRLLIAGAFGVVGSSEGMVAGEISILTAGARLYAGSFNAGLHASDDGGATWQRIATNPMALAIDGANVWLSNHAGLLKGTRVVLPGNVTKIAAAGNTILAARNAHELHVSHDAGETWSLALQTPHYTNITDITIEGNVVYATGFPVQVSLDGGRTWSVTNANAPFSSLLILPGSRTLLGGATVMRATTGSATFTPSANGLPANAVVEDFAFNGTTVFAALTPQQGDSLLYISNDRGETWQAHAHQPRVGRITNIAAKEKTIWIGTASGVYELTEGEAKRRRSVRK